MNNWQTIAANAHKVPGLWARYKKMTDYFEVFKGDNRIASVSSSDDSVVARSALMLIVDAIEAAGLARFERQIVNLGVRWIAKRIEDLDGNPIPAPLADEPLCREYVALATVVAHVLEQLPEGEGMKDNFEKFIELVRQGKIEGLWMNPDGSMTIDSKDWSFTVQIDEPLTWLKDHLCAHIRRWLNGKGYRFNLGSDELFVVCGGDTRIFREGPELKWHIDAALWVIAREGE